MTTASAGGSNMGLPHLPAWDSGVSRRGVGQPALKTPFEDPFEDFVQRQGSRPWADLPKENLHNRLNSNLQDSPVHGVHGNSENVGDWIRRTRTAAAYGNLGTSPRRIDRLRAHLPCRPL